MQNYSEEEIKDIKERVEKAETMLKELQLFPSAVVQKVKVGAENEDVFADKVICYLQDSKYTKING